MNKQKKNKKKKAEGMLLIENFVKVPKYSTLAIVDSDIGNM